MDYGQNFKKAFENWWNHKYLWVLGILVALFSGNGNQSNILDLAENDFGNIMHMPDAYPAMLNEYYIIAIVACSLFFIIFLVAGIYVKNVANAGLLAGAKNVYEGKVSSLKESWNNGRKYWVRFFMLELLVALPVILIFLFGIAVAITISLAGEIGDTLIVDMFGLLFVVLVCGALLIVLPLSALKPFAYRLILENDLGSIELLKSSWDIIRIRFSDIFISFLLAGAVTFIISLVLIPAVFMIFIPFMGGVLAGVTLLETSVILGILIIVVASICYLSVLSIFSGILNTYWQHYWTIVFEQVKGGQLQN